MSVDYLHGKFGIFMINIKVSGLFYVIIYIFKATLRSSNICTNNVSKP